MSFSSVLITRFKCSIFMCLCARVCSMNDSLVTRNTAVYGGLLVGTDNDERKINSRVGSWRALRSQPLFVTPH